MFEGLDVLFGGMGPHNYEERKVGLLKEKGLLISTAKVTDGECPYETAVESDKYFPGDMIIVEKYSNKKKALAGHNKWVKKMTSKKLPKKLVDCQNSWIGKLAGGKVVKLKGETK